MSETDSFTATFPSDYAVPVPHECVMAFLDNLEHVGPDLGCVPIVVGVAREDTGLNLYLESPGVLSLRDFALVLSWQTFERC